jgi:hypothetical protein
MLQMPGLTPDQQSLMLEKAAGNFLTMVENVGMPFVSHKTKRRCSSCRLHEPLLIFGSTAVIHLSLHYFAFL